MPYCPRCNCTRHAPCALICHAYQHDLADDLTIAEHAHEVIQQAIRDLEAE